LKPSASISAFLRLDGLNYALDAERSFLKDRRFELRAEVLVAAIADKARSEDSVVISQRLGNGMLESREGRTSR
jgi:hypothetical protein